jgi:predicted methyltransferase
MRNNTKTSVVILCCDSFLNKQACVLASVSSLLEQKGTEFEIVLLLNDSRKITVYHYNKIKSLIENHRSFKEGIVTYKTVEFDTQKSRGAARNIGVDAANGSLIIFIEDDTFLLSDDIIRKVASYAKIARYGFGANRKWILQKDFGRTVSQISSTSDDILQKLSNIAIDYSATSRYKNEDCYGDKTFIANFGYCFKSDFVAIGGFPDYADYGYEDDYLIYKLFTLLGKPKIMDEINVAHLDHPIHGKSKSGLVKYFKMLNSDGVYWFHVLNLLDKNNKFYNKKIIEPLNSIHFDHEIVQAYDEYMDSLPLDLLDASQKDRTSWNKNQMLNITRYSRQIDTLMKQKDLDEYVKNSEADFDNLAPVISSAVNNNLIKIDKNGKITPIKKFVFTEYDEKIKNEAFSPDCKLNQFPCDSRSVEKRIEFIKNKFPFCEYLRIAIIGDDDFLSLKLFNQWWIDAYIIEKDKRIIKRIEEKAPRFEIIEHDISSLHKVEAPRQIQTFITDPPYTYDGALSFIFTGLSMLDRSDTEKEFFVVLNPTMLGYHLDRVLLVLASQGITLVDTIKNFSQYELPKQFLEYSRKNEFLNHIKINSGAVRYSSSSNLYIFRTRKFNITGIRQCINKEGLYEHYK